MQIVDKSTIFIDQVNKMKVNIVIDSTFDLLPQYKEQTTVVPLRVIFDQEEYVDTVDLTHEMFYEKLVESDVLPRTSQASPSDFERVFSAMAQAGESAVVLTLSSTLSGTYQSACIAATEYPNIYVVDTKTAAIGGGILAQRALQLVAEGLDAATIAQRLEQEKQRVCIVALVDTLEYLKRGGRLSKAAAIAGGLLNIKPVLSLRLGEITVLGKARGSKQGNKLLVCEMEKAGGVDVTYPILLGYTGLSDALLQKYMIDSAPLWQAYKDRLPTTIIGSVIGTHVGPGAVAVAFFKNV